MFFTKEKNFYKFKYSNHEIYNVYIFFDKNSVNFYSTYYNAKYKTYFSKILYSFDINHTTDDNISILENLYFYLSHKSSVIEENIELDKNKEAISNDLIKYFLEISKNFFPMKIENNNLKILFLSFIFELYQCDTFKEDDEYNRVKNNSIFKLFGTKLQYLLSQKNPFEQKSFLKRKEKKWLNTLFMKKNQVIIEYANGYELINSPEKELESILDKERIKEIDNKKDKDLIELASNYFLSVLNIPKVFDIFTKNNSLTIISLMMFSILALIGSFFIAPQYQGVVILAFPIIILLMTIYNFLFHINITYLSILIMPRLFFSILVSWLALVSSYDLFFAHIHHSFYHFWIINIAIILIITFYFFIKIKNNRFIRIGSILIVSTFISLIQGLFILKFYINSFIVRSFTDENFNNLDIDTKLIVNYPYKEYIIKNIDTNKTFKLISDIPPTKYMDNLDLPFKDFFTIDVYILFGLIMIPVFFGLILQNIIDDKSIFKPLK